MDDPGPANDRPVVSLTDRASVLRPRPGVAEVRPDLEAAGPVGEPVEVAVGVRQFDGRLGRDRGTIVGRWRFDGRRLLVTHNLSNFTAGLLILAAGVEGPAHRDTAFIYGSGERRAMVGDAPGDVFELVDLSDYESTALETLLTIGRSTAPTLAEATGIPKARIYGVLESLADQGFVKITPTRPKEYRARPPADIVDRAIENRRQAFETAEAALEGARASFLDAFEARYEAADETVTPTEELFYVVDVGEPSERETRRLYDHADAAVYVVTKSFEYFESVRPSVESALERGVDIRVLFLQPSELSAENREIQSRMVDRLESDFPAIEFRFGHGPLPLRGTFSDPSLSYESGTAILLVEEKDIPLSMRQAAITENASFVAGLKRFFDLLWTYDSDPSR